MGDLQGPRSDDGASNLLTLRVPFTFFGTEYREIIVRITHVEVKLINIAKFKLYQLVHR